MEGFSLDAQRDKLFQYAEYKDFEIVREYCDAGSFFPVCTTALWECIVGFGCVSGGAAWVMGVHFLRDVIAGAVLGVVCAITGMGVWPLL